MKSIEIETSMPKKIVQIASWLAILAFVVGLVLFASNGRFVRYWADDYAYSLVAREGLIQGTGDWYSANGSRLSSFWFVGIIDLFGPNVVRYLPAVVLLLWIGCIYWFILEILGFFKQRIGKEWVILTSVLLVFFSVLLMPTRLETLYWRMATLHYTIPIPLTLLNAALIIYFLKKRSSVLQAAFQAVLVLIIAFISGAHGEASGAFQVGVYILMIVLMWIHNRINKEKHNLGLLFIALVGSAAAIVVMAKSPANQWRMEAMPPPASLGDFVFYTLRYSWDFVVDSLKTQPLPNFVFMLGSAAVALAVFPQFGWSISTRSAIIGIAAAVVLTYGLIVFSVAPSVYAGTNYPAPRALMPSRFTLLTGLMAASFFGSSLLIRLGKRLTKEHWSWVAATLLIMISAYAVRSYPVAVAEGQDLAVKAELWDKQDQAIRAAKQAGQMDVIIKQYDVVDSLESLFDDPENWLNRSAAAWYGVNSITALP